MSLPQQKITVTHNGIDYSFENEAMGVTVGLRENAGSSCEFTANDYQSKTFLSKCGSGDNVKVEFRGDPAGSWTQVFGGWISKLTPSLSEKGEVVGITALGYSVALANMLVRQQYGTQSVHSNYDGLRDVIQGATYGIVPQYVNKVMASATNSGYSINTTKVADVTSTFRYLYFPGKPAIKCLEDMLDLISAANVPNAGAHWIVVPDGTTAYLCVATIGAHENPPADVWPTWWNTDQAGSTIEVKKDMIVAGFEQKRPEANYVFFVGNFRRPSNMDKLTEYNASEWDSDNTTKPANDGTNYKVGSYSIKQGVTGTAQDVVQFWYPKTGTFPLPVDKFGTMATGANVSFFARKHSIGATPKFLIYLSKGAVTVGVGDYFYSEFHDNLTSDDKWYRMVLPIGSFYDSTLIKWIQVGTLTWNEITRVGFVFQGNEDSYVNVDGLCFEGCITRAAYDSSKFASQRCRMKFIRDDVPKDDSLDAADDGGEMAQFAKSELYRAMSEPIIGQIVIPMQEQILPGQLAHIHFGKKSGGTFNLDKNMRIVQVFHKSAPEPHGFKTYLTLTDDIVNSHPVQPTDQYNLIMRAVTPSFADRYKSSITVKDIDIDQTILAKDYA